MTAWSVITLQTSSKVYDLPTKKLPDFWEIVYSYKDMYAPYIFGSSFRALMLARL